MSYREKPATPNSPSGTSVTTMYDHLLSPPSPGAEEEEKDDRLRNDLLDEICNDMGIDDSMDLDLDDFCYNGQQPPPPQKSAGGARFGPGAQTSVKSEVDARRGSVATSSSGYTTSDSLCAIAKLTQSISSEAPSSVHSEGEANRSPQEVKNDMSDSIEGSHVNDTDQGKVAAMSNKMKAQRQRLNGSASPFQAAGIASSETKRKRPDEVATETDSQTCPMNEQTSLQQQQSWPPTTGYQPAAVQR